MLNVFCQALNIYIISRHFRIYTFKVKYNQMKLLWNMLGIMLVHLESIFNVYFINIILLVNKINEKFKREQIEKKYVFHRNTFLWSYLIKILISSAFWVFFECYQQQKIFFSIFFISLKKCELPLKMFMVLCTLMLTKPVHVWSFR